MVARNKFVWRNITDSSRMRFWEKVNKLTTDDCWEWKGTKKSDGYGVVYSAGKQIGAHRYSWIMHNRDTDKCVLHRCDNPTCVNPNHLFLGEPRHNVKDMIKKGRDNFWGYRDKAQCVS